MELNIITSLRRKQKRDPEFFKELIKQIWYACRGFRRLRKYGDWCYIPLPCKTSNTSITADGESYDSPNNLLSDEEKDVLQDFINANCGKPLEEVKTELSTIFEDVRVLHEKKFSKSQRDISRFKADLSCCSNDEKDMLRQAWSLAWRHATERAKQEFELYVRTLLRIAPQYPLEHLAQVKEAWAIALENGLLSTAHEMDVYTMAIYHSMLWAKAHTTEKEIERNIADRQRLDYEWEMAAIRAMKLPAGFNVYDALFEVSERKRRSDMKKNQAEELSQDKEFEDEAIKANTNLKLK